YRSFRPQGKVRRRVQDLRISSASRADFPAGGHRLDLSHNESARMAVDSLLSRGLKEYHQVLRAEGEVDFLSQPEKMYIMENGRAGSAGSSRTGSSTSGDQVESSLPDSQGDTLCPAPSTDSDPPASEDQSCQRDVSSCVPVKPSLEVFFQSHGGAASMKDLIREFMRKATETLAIVMDSFSDVELLCDLLEASRKRNVSVYLLLDHLNLSLFLHMWQELQLNSKNFPKLCVRSVQGQTYCARTGRKLTGQIRESFIITDWTEVLTGSFSFSWLSWQVHRSLAVLLKGSAVPPFNTEFLRLNSSSQTVPG
uniref:Family with sequence similarity 83 member A n=1 Tax=Tetraodon nigroviridis TaxID=99883 RepID=H3DP22_TETNG